ncbi:MAG: cation diffusion facilitator family transporter [Gemmatimonadota bacterium]|nr:cation diffusion facilitator family transporter [Gemmatimonadota bacterium]
MTHRDHGTPGPHSHPASRGGHHHHGHDHAPGDFNRAFLIGVVLNVGFVVAEVVFGLISGSLALLSDAGHNASDVLGLLLAWGAAALAARGATARRTFGFRRATILAALASAVLLFMAVGVIAWEAVRRTMDPQPVEGMTVVVVAAIGVVINGLTAALFHSGKDHDLNLRGAYLHMAADAAVSLGVVVTGVVILRTGWFWIDPAISLVVVLVILVGTWGLFRDSFDLAVDAVPRGIDPAQVEQYLASLAGVESVHDLHIWGMSTTETALTAHLVMPRGATDGGFLNRVRKGLEDRFHIHHATLQVEAGDERYPCPEAEHCG